MFSSLFTPNDFFKLLAYRKALGGQSAYLAVVMLFTWLLGILERNLKKNER